MRRPLTEKWSQYNLLKKCNRLSNNLPETFLYSVESFWALLERDKQVIVKPCTGRFGYGVLLVSDVGDGHYEYHIENKKVSVTGKEQVTHFLKEGYAYKNKRCIVQQVIPLARIDGSPYDIRVMVQRKRFGYPWEVTGKAVKVAMNGYIATNIPKMILPFEQAIVASSISHPAETLSFAIDRVALIASKQLKKWKVNKLGLDIGIDTMGNILIIEVNARPILSIFTMLEDKEMYKRMINYHKR